MHLETQLIILHIDFQEGINKCLLDNGEIPSVIIEDEHPVAYVPIILSKYLKIEADWVQPVLVDVGFLQDKLIIYYTCMIPNIIENTGGKWCSVGEIENGDIQKIVFEAGQKLLTRF